MGTSFSPHRQDRGVPFEQVQGARHEVVEVEAAGRSERLLIGHEGAGDRPSIEIRCDAVDVDIEVELQS